MPTHPASAYRGSAARYTGASRGPSPARCRSPTGHRGGARGAPPPPRPTDAGTGDGGTGTRPRGTGTRRRYWRTRSPGRGTRPGERPWRRPRPTGRTHRGQSHPRDRYLLPGVVLANGVPRSTGRSPASAYRGALPGTPGHDPALGHRSSSPTPGPNGRPPAPTRLPAYPYRAPTRPAPGVQHLAPPSPYRHPPMVGGAGEDGEQHPGSVYRDAPQANVPDAPGGRRTGCSRGDAPGRTANSIPTSGAPVTGSCSRGPPANSAPRSTPSASSSPMSRCAGAGGARALGESDASNPPGPGTAGGVYPVAWTGTSPGTFGPGRHPDVPLPGWRPYLPARSGPVPPCLIRYAIPGGYCGTNLCALAPPGTWPPYSPGYLAALVGEGATNISLSR